MEHDTREDGSGQTPGEASQEGKSDCPSLLTTGPGALKAYEAIKKSASGLKKVRKLRSPVKRFGSKAPHVGKLLPLICGHQVYAETYGGGAALLFAKRPSPVEVINDIDGGVINLFRVLQDPLLFEEFYRLVYVTPYSREQYYHCRDHWKEYQDPVQRAWAYYVACRQAFSSEIGAGWSHGIVESRGGMAGTVQRWLSIIELLPEICERLRRVQIECMDFRKFLPKYDLLTRSSTMTRRTFLLPEGRRI